MHRAERVRARLGAHLCGQDRVRRVCDRDRPAREAARDLHVADQGAVQPEVPRAEGGVRRRGPAHGRRDHRRERELPRDDDGDPALDALPRERGDARGEVGHLRRGALHARQGARRRVGGGDDPAAAQGALRLPLGHHPQRARVRRVDRRAPRPAVPRRVHRVPADAAAALHVPQRRRRHPPHRRRAEQLPTRQLPARRLGHQAARAAQGGQGQGQGQGRGPDGHLQAGAQPACVWGRGRRGARPWKAPPTTHAARTPISLYLPIPPYISPRTR